MTAVKFFLPASLGLSDISVVLREAEKNKLSAPFDEVLTNFVTDFSKSVLLDRHARAYPELIVLANFFKPYNVAKLKTELKLEKNGMLAGRGIVFHLAPSNVDAVFLYSSLLSLLCGNVNFIKISRNSSSQLTFILDKLNELLSNAHAHLANRFFVLTYDHNDAVTSLISEHSHMRVVWGGDATVRKIRSIPLRPTASEICFPDRFSAAMLDAEAVLRLDQAGLTDVCSKFFNDSIWFAQQACSSPRLVAWIGQPDACESARQKFWTAFELHLHGKNFENTPGMAMDRLVACCRVAIDPAHRETASLIFPVRILLSNDSLENVKQYHCGNGLFFEQCFESVPGFFQTLTDKEQTLSVFGFESAEIAKYLNDLPLRSIDRVTKFGKALDFSHVWDGYNLLRSFTRQIFIEP